MCTQGDGLTDRRPWPTPAVAQAGLSGSGPTIVAKQGETRFYSATSEHVYHWFPKPPLRSEDGIILRFLIAHLS